ncbi:MauE/DoxX family redox-associated membrane protein [Actinomyces sp. Z5]|uniref:MauE/DoxX family redox-associated membrane protein n=1 Tax=Actinomyces sp. Z5 TaxID=2250216 RepID=UPI001C65D86E|nr:MauE/DoxX family redox-associated membrane protein [Actinomyces sp. Z5]
MSPVSPTVPVALAVGRILIGLLLTVSAYAKLATPRELQVADVAGYRLLPGRGPRAVAIALPAVELFLAGCLVLGGRLPITETITAVLLLALAGASVSVLARGIKADCGYFGSRLRWRVGPGVVAANVALAAVLVADLLVTPQRLVLASPGSNMVVIVLGIAMFFNLLTNWDKFRQPQPA